MDDAFLGDENLFWLLSASEQRERKKRGVCFKFLCRQKKRERDLLIPFSSSSIHLSIHAIRKRAQLFPPSLSFLLLPSRALLPLLSPPSLCSQTCSCLFSSLLTAPLSSSSHQLSLLPLPTTKRQPSSFLPLKLFHSTGGCHPLRSPSLFCPLRQRRKPHDGRTDGRKGPFPLPFLLYAAAKISVYWGYGWSESVCALSQHSVPKKEGEEGALPLARLSLSLFALLRAVSQCMSVPLNQAGRHEEVRTGSFHRHVVVYAMRYACAVHI